MFSRWLAAPLQSGRWAHDGYVASCMLVIVVYWLLWFLRQIRCVLGTKVLQNTNRKSYPIDRMVPLSMTLSDLWPGFQCHDIFDIEYLRNDSRQSHTIERMHSIDGDIPNDLDRPLTDFEGHSIFEVGYLKNGVSWGQSCYRTLTENHRWRMDPCRFRRPWVTLKGRMRRNNFCQADLNNTG